LIYRAFDFDITKEDYTVFFPATDREVYPEEYPDFIPASGVESKRFLLTMAQVKHRLDQNKIVKNIIYKPLTTFEKGKFLSQREVGEVHDQVIEILRRQLRPSAEPFLRGALLDQARFDLSQELGREPTQGEITERYEKLLRNILTLAAEKEKHPELENALIAQTKLYLPTPALFSLDAQKIISFKNTSILDYRAVVGDPSTH
jgi:hypothetical protein